MGSDCAFLSKANLFEHSLGWLVRGAGVGLKADNVFGEKEIVH